MTILERVNKIGHLFSKMDGLNASSYQIAEVANFRKVNPELNDDLDFCFEVLAGKHKLGYTLKSVSTPYQLKNTNWTIREFYDNILRTDDLTDAVITMILHMIPNELQPFIIPLANREYRLGYTNRGNMVTDKHCMLAKTYPDHVVEGTYYIQEKLNGNRCIAYYEDNEWKYLSRSQKPMNVSFDMTGLDTNRVYDGEVMTRNKMGNRDFAATTGAINSKYGDKSNLIYFIYDILDDKMPYVDRYKELMGLETSHNVRILPVIDYVYVYRDPSKNLELDIRLDIIVSKGGEGIMLRDPFATYHHSKNSGDRRACLLKYKKTKTCDLRITGWNEGKGKYAGMIGSFLCESDDGRVVVNVAGMSDDIRMSNPDNWLGRIIEVAYFETSRAKNKDVVSLQFPRMKGIRLDKDETSMF